MNAHRGHQKHERAAVRAAEELSEHLSAHVENRSGQNGHSWLVLTHDQHRNTPVRITLPSSPSQPEAVPRNVRQTARREFLKKGITL